MEQVANTVMISVEEYAELKRLRAELAEARGISERLLAAENNLMQDMERYRADSELLNRVREGCEVTVTSFSAALVLSITAFSESNGHNVDALRALAERIKKS